MTAKIVLGCLVLLAVGCSKRTANENPPRSVKWKVAAVSSSSPGSLARPPVEAQPLAIELCAALHVLPARRVAECCGQSETRYFYDECVRVTSQALVSRTISVSPSSVRDCTQAMETALDGCDWVKPGQPLGPQACQGLIHGRMRLGQTCRSSLECNESLHCSAPGPDGLGRCTAAEPPGAACGSNPDPLASYVLDRDLDRQHATCRDFCSLAAHRCAPVPAEGSACRSSINCATGQTCVEGKCSSQPNARVLAATDESCKTDFDCKVGGCVSDESGHGVCGKLCPGAALARMLPNRAAAARPR